MLRPTALITYAVAFFTFFFQSRFAAGQSIQSSIRQMDEIHRFYRTWSKLYANDLFRSVYPSQSLSTFGGSQMLSPSAWSIELRGGSIISFPGFIKDEYYSALDSFRNIKFDVRHISDNKLRFKQYNETLIPEERIVFTVFDDNGRPINAPAGVVDSTKWRLPSMYQMGLSESLIPTFNFTLRWAPGYAFEFAGTYRLYDSDPLNNSLVVTDNSNRFYNMYLAHDALYWFQSLHMRGWHLTLNAGLSNWTQSVNLNDKFKLFNDYNIGTTEVRFGHQMNSIDIYNRSTNYGVKFGKSWHDVEVWGGFDYLFTMGGMSDDGSIDAIFNDENPGFSYRKYREFFFTGIQSYRFYNFHLGAMIGQKNIRVGGQYNILSNGTQQASVSVRYVFRDNERHPWQLDVPEEMFFDPTKKIIKTKTVIMVRDNEDEEYREQKPPID